MKKTLLTGLIVLLLTLLVVSCGVPQEEYDQLAAEAEAAIADRDAEIEALTGELEAVAVGIEKARQYMAIAANMYNPVISGEGLDDPGLVDTVGGLVADMDDATLQGHYDAWAASPADIDLAFELLTYALEQIEATLSE